MSKDISLKTQNAPLVISFLVLQTTIYIMFIIGFDDFWKETLLLFSQLNSKNSILIAAAPLLSFVLSGVISPNLKYNIIFWKIKNPLPGTRVFTKIAPQDVRIDLEVLKRKLNRIPEDPTEQNKLWYRLYKEIEDATSVRLAHKNFLLARDLATISFIFLVLTPWTVLFITKNINISGIYSLILLVEYVVFCIVAQNEGNRFVCNVLAEYCCKQEVR